MPVRMADVRMAHGENYRKFENREKSENCKQCNVEGEVRWGQNCGEVR